VLTTFEKSEIQLLAKELLKELLPKLKTSEETSANDFVFDVKQLSEYLNVPESWVYRQTCDHNIPYYKLGRYNRFKKTEIDKWLEEKSVNPIPKA
jgi:excisionase family DNA binding protein